MPTDMLAALPAWQVGFLASLLVGVAAGLGALPIFLIRHIGTRIQDVLLGFAGGIMLAACAFSLFLPAIEIGTAQWGSPMRAALAAAAAALIGAVVLYLIHQSIPHEHFVKGRENADHVRIRRLWLFVLAITLHNFPEGLAVGGGVGAGDPGQALGLTAGMFLQNLPEGLTVALALLPLGFGPGQAVLIALATGGVETIGGVLGVLLATTASSALPWSLAGAGGAMLFVISHEIIPETHRNGHETAATFGLMAGFVIMMVLDTALA